MPNGSSSPELRQTTLGALKASEATLLIATPLHPKSEAHAERVFGRVLRPGVGGWTREAALAEADAIVLRAGTIRAPDLALAPRVRIVARNGTGYDTVDLDACVGHGVVVTNVPGGNAEAVAELTLALALAVTRRVAELDARIRSGELVRSITALCPGLLGRTVGLVGMGDIAYAAARMFAAFGCRLLVYSPTSPPSRWVVPDERYPTPVAHERVTLDELLAQAHVVSLHCPLTEQTRGMIGKTELGRMRPDAVLLNTSRGAMVDEAALAEALRTGGIAGAGLDVTAVEPAYGDNLAHFAGLRNVVVTPHVGASTDAAQEYGCDAAIDICADFVEGRGARNRVA
ncbi:hypothetical protein Q8F55_007024 [Vanrija albida]|uniref:Phosphoglycerate dehydrogenase n=1 Tax=Vanrija albida TaxID=181172 RepID=A0ABR3PYM9_9TREE